MTKKILPFFIAAVLTSAAADAQMTHTSTLNVTGGSAIIDGNTHEWSIGEMVLVNTAKAGNVIITQGLLQPQKSAGSNALDESRFIFDHVNVYPNPADNLFFLDADFKEDGVLRSTLYDMNGKIIEHKEVNSNGQKTKLQYNISELSAGNYMLLVSFISENSKAGSKAAFKIEKTN